MKGLPVSAGLYDEVRSLVLSVRQNISRGVDLLQIHTNYEIGWRIVEQEQHGSDRAEYGKEILKDLSARLTAEFGAGISRSNLEYMRRFYLAYPDRTTQISQTTSGISGFRDTAALRPISQTPSGKSDEGPNAPFSLSWSHYVFLLGLNAQERRFYEIEATQQGWTLRELKRQYNAGLFERLALSRDREAIGTLTQKGHQVSKPEDLLKEPYVLEFLGLAERASYSESDLESAIVTHVENFLLELGKGFLFEARQKRFTFDEEHFFIDLVLYNRLLRVEITLPKDANIHAREYQLYLPSKEELQRKLAEWIEEQDPVAE